MTASVDVVKPRVFIGSSREGLEVAKKFAERIEPCARVARWWDRGTFSSSTAMPPLETLLDDAGRVDFAVLVATRDDPVRIRRGPFEKGQHAMRDNVLLEFGIFTGRIGKERTHLLLPIADDTPADDSFRIPTDLLGINCLRYGGRPTAEVYGAIAEELCAWMQRLATSSQREKNARDWGRRLLRFASWARSELAGASVWSTNGLQRLGGKLQGASAFLLEEVDFLGLRSEFDAMVDAMLAATEAFPAGLLDGAGFIDEDDRYDAFERIRMRVHYADGVTRERRSPAFPTQESRWLETRAEFLRSSSWHDHWRHFRDVPSDGSCPLCAIAWWSLGAQETLGEVSMRLEALESWARGSMTAVHERFDAFETRLYDRVVDAGPGSPAS